MRVLLASNRLPPEYSGVGHRVSRHAEFLFSRGFLAYIFTTTKTYKNSDNFYLKKIDQNKIISLYSRSKASKLPLKLYMVFEFIVVFFQAGYYIFSKRKEFDIAHCFSNEPTSLFVAFFSILFSKKVIMESTLLGSDSGPTGALSSLKTFLYKRSSFIVCISEALRREYIKHGFPEEKIIVIPNDVDTTLFFPVSENEKTAIKKELGLALGSKYILFVGALTYRKGLDIMLGIFKNFNNIRSDLHFIFIGRTNSVRSIDLDIIEELEDLRNDKKFKNILDVRGPVENVESYMKIADVFVFPSRREGFGTVQIEAMASGCPVISAYLPDITETIIEDGVDGCVVYDCEDIGSYVDKIGQILASEEKSDFLVTNGLNKVSSVFSRNSIMSRYIGLYKSLIYKKEIIAEG